MKSTSLQPIQDCLNYSNYPEKPYLLPKGWAKNARKATSASPCIDANLQLPHAATFCNPRRPRDLRTIRVSTATGPDFRPSETLLTTRGRNVPSLTCRNCCKPKHKPEAQNQVCSLEFLIIPYPCLSTCHVVRVTQKMAPPWDESPGGFAGRCRVASFLPRSPRASTGRHSVGTCGPSRRYVPSLRGSAGAQGLSA